MVRSRIILRIRINATHILIAGFWNRLDIYSSSRGLVLFSDPTIRKRYNIVEIILISLLYIGQFCLFVYAVWFDNSTEEKSDRQLSLLSIDGQALGGAQLALSTLCALAMACFALVIALKKYRLVKGGVQLHFVMILWVTAFFGQGLITLLAQWFDQYASICYFPSPVASLTVTFVEASVTSGTM